MQRKRQEREFDPVAMKFRNPDKEAQIEMQRTAQLDSRIQRVSELKQKTFNIISHEGPPRRIDSLPSLTRDHSAQRPYHMLTNMPKPLHHDAPTIYDETYSLTVYKQTILPVAPTNTGKRREFNIISNDYFENPVEKKREEYEKLKTHVLNKYWQTHDFDIVKGRYYSPEKEDRYQQQRRVMEEVQGRALESILPPGVEYADGHSYNILTHEIYDDSRLQAATTMEQRQLNRIKKRQVEAAQREAGEKAFEAHETRRMARISRQKYDSALDSGFNPITNEKVPTNRPQPLPERPPTMWARITMQPASSSANSPAAYGEFDHSRIPTAQGPPKTAGAVTGGRDGIITGVISGGRFRDLSGAATRTQHHSSSPQLPSPSPQPQTQVPSSSRGNLTNNNNQHQHQQQPKQQQPSTSRQQTAKIPSLDISRADFGEPVVYQEPSNKAPPGASVAMVRTGGLSSYR